MTGSEGVACVRNLKHTYGAKLALDGITLEIQAGRLTGFIGPDGVGKSTLLGIIAGTKRIQSGGVITLGGDMADPKHRVRISPRIAYMPQGLGKNLYPDLSVEENIAFFASLFGQHRTEREVRIADLCRSTGLSPYKDRPARKLSGGMRQKLGLCCALVHDPDLLILDEPTTGIDPLSRRQFWDLIERMRVRRKGMSVLVATAYMDEAERFESLAVLNDGQVLATGTPSEIKAATGKDRLEESFIALLPDNIRAGHRRLHVPPRRLGDREPVIVARNLTRRFGDFVAVDGVSFSIEQGEIFGFVGSNGCGKTTTMKMLTGLLPPSAGEALLFGYRIDTRDIAGRSRVGYMSQSFSLYTELTVRQNLALHAHLFHLPSGQAHRRIATLIDQFGLGPHADENAAALPLGIRQRLSLAVAVVHQPELLILDEPTSGVDPIARDRFWELLVDLSRNQGVTIFVSTHFMNEAARCDRIALMDSGRVLATGPPADLVAAQECADLEDAFIAYLEKSGSREHETGSGVIESGCDLETPALRMRHAGISLGRLFAYSRREALELLRDPIRLGFSLLGTAFLMLVFGFGINTDVDHIPFAVLDRDKTPESWAYIEELRGSYYFTERPELSGYDAIEHRIQTGELKVAIEIPPGFGRDLRRNRPTEVGAWVDGAMPFRAETARGYLQGVHERFLADLTTALGATVPAASASIETRFRYNQDFKSAYAMVPGTLSMLLALIPAILMALAVVREKELGSIVNLYVTPVRRIEFILGKQLPYIGLAFVNFLCLVAIATAIFQVPLKGSFPTLAVGALLYVTATTGYGLFISSFASTQIAALFGTAILTVLPATQFSGLLTPVSALSGLPAVMGHAFPMTYFLPISVGVFTKSLGFRELTGSMAALAAFIPVLTLLSLVMLRKQER